MRQRVNPGTVVNTTPLLFISKGIGIYLEKPTPNLLVRMMDGPNNREV
jgi:hypothetical protein